LLTQNWRIEFSITGSLAILYLGVGCSLVAGWIWNKGLEKVRANTGGIFLALEPIFGVIMAVVLLDESIGVVALAGIILVIVAAMVSVVWQSNPREV
jgi:drug/metabolite transporter (DMT)-like permease